MSKFSSALLLIAFWGVTFPLVSAEIDAPDHWQAYAIRDEIAPIFAVDKPTNPQDSAPYYLVLSGRGSEAVDGRWRREESVEENRHYQFSAEYRSQNVKTPIRSILARVIWLAQNGKQIGRAEYPHTVPKPTQDSWHRITSTYQVPPGATRARLELHLRWAPQGKVSWRNIHLSKTPAPKPRVVRLATVHHRPRNSSGPQHNLRQFGKLLEQAAENRVG